jgi:membrane protein YdbS with pleckstrin-like domain
MKMPTRESKHAFLLAIVAIALMAGHGVVLYYVSSHVAASAAIVSGMVLLVVVKHLGLIGALHAWWRRRLRHRSE